MPLAISDMEMPGNEIWITTIPLNIRSQAYMYALHEESMCGLSIRELNPSWYFPKTDEKQERTFDREAILFDLSLLTHDIDQTEVFFLEIGETICHGMLVS